MFYLNPHLACMSIINRSHHQYQVKKILSNILGLQPLVRHVQVIHRDLLLLFKQLRNNVSKLLGIN
jgi:hypothetical protein